MDRFMKISNKHFILPGDVYHDSIFDRILFVIDVVGRDISLHITNCKSKIFYQDHTAVYQATYSCQLFRSSIIKGDYKKL